MKKKLRQWLSIETAKNPGRMVLAVILLFNVVFFFLAAVVISKLSLSGTEQMGFLEAAFCTVTMILDAGCIQFVVSDIGRAGVGVVVTCLGIILVGMISFTGAVIGYLTNYISNFIEDANTGSRKLHISGHLVILNWNTRASEIINDLLYCRGPQKVVVLVSSRKAEIEKEIKERISDTISRENQQLRRSCRGMGVFRRLFTVLRDKMHDNVTVIVREGDVFSSKQLRDICLEQAKTVIILGNDINASVCRFETMERSAESERGNSQTVKTLMQVADITAAEDSSDNQKIIVEITDDWTDDLVKKIIACKQVREKCNIIPVRVNQILGQLLSQFSLMPELNLVYKELFSNKGSAIFTEPFEIMEGKDFIPEYLREHRRAIPLTYMMGDDGLAYHYFSSASERDVHTAGPVNPPSFKARLNRDYWIESKCVIILGHNSKCRDIMQGFSAFVSEWSREDSEILRIVVIDDKKNLEKMDYYRDYPFVAETVSASIYDKDLICSTIERIVSEHGSETSILILSDDAALNEDIDAGALANLVYVQDIISRKVSTEPGFDRDSMDIVVEIIDPKHHDIVTTYSVNNVVISNRYISKMITQIGEKEALFDFYSDILTYDTDVSEGYNSKEIYIKSVKLFFEELPPRCTAESLIRAVYEASMDESIPPEVRNPTVVLGYVKAGGKTVLFEGDQSLIDVELEEQDKLIVFSSH